MANGVPTFQQFQKLLRGTPMAGEARGVYNAAIRGGINPAFVAGLAMAESSGGKSGYAVGTHNPYGLGVHLGWKFPNYAQATSRLARTLNNSSYRKLYKQSGARGVIGRYTPWGDASNNPNSHTSNIEKYGSSTGGNASIIYLNGPSAGMAPAAGPPGVQPPMPTGQSQNSMGNSAIADLLSAGPSIMGGNPNDTLLQAAIAKNSGTAAYSPATNTQTSNEGLVYGSIAPSGAQPRLSKWGGPSDHRARALHNWQSDTAYDLGGKAGTLVVNPMDGRIVKISGHPGGNPQFAGYGVTVDYGGGKQLFFKHIGKLAPGLRAGQRLRRGQSLGGLEASTGGGPHLHLGATNDAFLGQVLSFYTGGK